MLLIPEGLRWLRPEDFGSTIGELMERFPDDRIKAIGNQRTRWKVDEGANGTGSVAIAVLDYDKPTQDMTVLGAIQNDTAPEHQHLGIEIIYTMAGIGQDTTDEGEPVQLHPGSILIHGAGTTHSPGSRSFWVFLYRQPRGMRLVTPPMS